MSRTVSLKPSRLCWITYAARLLGPVLRYLGGSPRPTLRGARPKALGVGVAILAPPRIVEWHGDPTEWLSRASGLVGLGRSSGGLGLVVAGPGLGVRKTNS